MTKNFEPANVHSPQSVQAKDEARTHLLVLGWLSEITDSLDEELTPMGGYVMWSLLAMCADIEKRLEQLEWTHPKAVRLAECDAKRMWKDMVAHINGEATCRTSDTPPAEKLFANRMPV